MLLHNIKIVQPYSCIVREEMKHKYDNLLSECGRSLVDELIANNQYHANVEEYMIRAVHSTE